MAKIAESMEKIIDAMRGIEDDRDINVFTSGTLIKPNANFVLLFYDTFSKLLNKLTLTDVKVLIGLLKVTQFGNCISINHTKLAEVCNIHRVQVSKSMKNLERENCIFTCDFGTFVNPSLISKGSLEKIDVKVWEQSLMGVLPCPIDVAKVKNKQSKIANKTNVEKANLKIREEAERTHEDKT
jgi:predicted transcriptional regulator